MWDKQPRQEIPLRCIYNPCRQNGTTLRYVIPRERQRSGGMTCRGWCRSTAQVVFETLLGDESSPLHCVAPFIPTGDIRNVPWNGTQAVPYGFADWCTFLHNVFQNRHVRCPENCQLSIVNCQFPRRSLQFRWEVDSFNRTGSIRNVDGGRLPPLHPLHSTVYALSGPGKGLFFVFLLPTGGFLKNSKIRCRQPVTNVLY